MDEVKQSKRTSKDLWAKLKPLAKEKRQNPTPAEAALWDVIRNRKVLNLKFRRQYIIERFIVDFYCAELQLVIEIDGDIHQFQQAADKERQDKIESHGITVIRFTNQQVLEEIDNVIGMIKLSAQKLRDKNSPSPLNGEGAGG